MPLVPLLEAQLVFKTLSKEELDCVRTWLFGCVGARYRGWRAAYRMLSALEEALLPLRLEQRRGPQAKP